MTGSDGRLFETPKFKAQRSHYREALQQWLAARHPEWHSFEVVEITVPERTGFSNDTVMLEAVWQADGEPRQGRFVARVEPSDGPMFPAQTPQCAVSVDLQYRAMAAVAAAAAVPVPPLLGYEPDPTLLGRPFFVMGHVPGEVPSDVPRYTESGFVVDASADERRAMVLGGVELLAGVHSLDWRPAGMHWLDPSGRGQPTMAHQIELYRGHSRRELAGREHPVLFKALDWLAAEDPDDGRIGLTWGDARLGNVIWQDFRPVAVLDWEVASLIPTEADIGWWIMFDRMSFDDLGVDRLDGYPTRREQIAHYEQTSGNEVRDPHYWEVFAAVRFCAIFVRLGDRLTTAGFFPESRNPAVGNQVTAALARLLDIPNPTPDLLAI